MAAIEVPETVRDHLATYARWWLIDETDDKARLHLAEHPEAVSRQAMVAGLPRQLEEGEFTLVARGGGFGGYLVLKMVMEDGAPVAYLYSDNRMSGDGYARIDSHGNVTSLPVEEYYAAGGVVSNARAINQYLENQ